jgi:very-short-patch-repair endonuclease
MVLLRGYAEKLRAHQTVAEERLKLRLGPEYWFQVPLDNYILDFFHPQELIDVEIDGKRHLAYPRRDANRAYALYEKLGICTIRFLNEEVIKDIDLCIVRLNQFRKNPIIPTKWQETPEDVERKKLRKIELGEIRTRVVDFENRMMKKTRREVISEFERLQPQDDLDLEVFERLYKKVYFFWPEEGYTSPGLQTITARIKSR